MIQELEAQGFVIDAIAGTSIGAVVGACHAAGKLAHLEAFARGLTRRQVLGLMDLSLGGTGLIGGARLERRLSRDLGGLRIEDLQIPFAAVATELRSGREARLERGDLVEAVRASYALPGIFSPLLVGGRWLFDGAMSNPVPVSVCRALGSSFVIAVNLTAALHDQVEDDVSGDAARDDADPAPLTARAATAAYEGYDMSDSEVAAVAMLDAQDAKLAGIRKAAESRKTSGIRQRLVSARRRLSADRSDDAPGIASVVVGAFSVAQERISRATLANDPPDAMLFARLSSVGLFDFHRATELIDHGRAITRAAVPEIARLVAGADRSKQDGDDQAVAI